MPRSELQFTPAEMIAILRGVAPRTPKPRRPPPPKPRSPDESIEWARLGPKSRRFAAEVKSRGFLDLENRQSPAVARWYRTWTQSTGRVPVRVDYRRSRRTAKVFVDLRLDQVRERSIVRAVFAAEPGPVVEGPLGLAIEVTPVGLADHLAVRVVAALTAATAPADPPVAERERE